MKTIALLLVAAGMLAGADFEACPSSIDVRPHEIAKASAGWTVGHDLDTFQQGRNHVLWFVTMYNGNPKERASLVPDVNEKVRTEWKFDVPATTFWMECHYMRTTLVLARPLPKGVKSCEVRFEADMSIDGHQAIQRMTCR